MVDPDPTPDPDPTWKYGDYDTVFNRIGIESEEPTYDSLEIALNSADVYIETSLSGAGLPLPLESEDWPPALIQCANYYAIADALQPLFNNNEDKNEKVLYYLQQANTFLESYITIEAYNQKDETLNPYSVSQSCIPRPPPSRYRPYREYNKYEPYFR